MNMDSLLHGENRQEGKKTDTVNFSFLAGPVTGEISRHLPPSRNREVATNVPS